MQMFFFQKVPRVHEGIQVMVTLLVQNFKNTEDIQVSMSHSGERVLVNKTESYKSVLT